MADKKEILAELERTGEVNKKSKHPKWVEAFELYKAQTKDTHVSMECGVCFATVLKWLKK